MGSSYMSVYNYLANLPFVFSMPLCIYITFYNTNKNLLPPKEEAKTSVLPDVYLSPSISQI